MTLQGCSWNTHVDINKNKFKYYNNDMCIDLMYLVTHLYAV